MTNLPNRSNYGYLNCIYSIWKSRYNNDLENLNILDLKYNKSFENNSIDYCRGAKNYNNKLTENRLGRKKYCPFLVDNTAAHVCNLVYAKDSDSQKSKPAGQTALILSILDLVKLNYSGDKVISFNWNSKNSKYLKLNWGDEKLNKYLLTKILEFGPIIGLIKLIKNKVSKNKFNKSDITQFVGFANFTCSKKIKEFCEITNCNKKNLNLTINIGNTSNDAKTRTLKTLLLLLAHTNIISPIDSDQKFQKPIIDFDNWLFSKDNFNKISNKWIFNEKLFEKLIKKNKDFKIKKTIEYRHLDPKAVHRNATDKCDICNQNIKNKFKSKYSDILKLRRYTLIKMFSMSFKNKITIKKEKIHQFFSNNNYYITKNYKFELNAEIDFIDFITGCFLINNNDNLIPSLDITEIDLGNIKNVNEINKKINKFFKYDN